MLRNVARTNARRQANEIVTDQLAPDLLVDPQADDDRLSRVFEHLSSGERQVLVLVTEGYSVSETAAALAITPGAVSAKIQRIKRKLRQATGEQDVRHGARTQGPLERR